VGDVETSRCPDPRIERTRRVVLDATIDLLVEGGYGAVTIEAVAARSGVAKSTIYRHWPGRLELINDAFQELKPPVPVPAQGPVRERLIVVLEHLAHSVAGSTWSACLPALIDAAERDPAAREFHAGLARAGRQTLVDLLDEGVRTGEFGADLDTELIAEALAGPIMLRRLMAYSPLDPSEVRHLVDQVVGPDRHSAKVSSTSKR
jgi:TetR/AcrR family transcriptional regulator, regulator of autoinduction and epiphytic fitness